ncbi:hypothetical protein COCOBI_11-5430 [Coccomyxa sp. Obi]|nr:hypothetical protein COCOBI_11-5430 [Coccomyxa sp. Obi]
MDRLLQNFLFTLLVATSVAVPFLIAKHAPSDAAIASGSASPCGWPTRSFGSVGSVASIGSVGSLWSIGSVGSILSIASIGGVLSIGSIGGAGTIAALIGVCSFGGFLSVCQRSSPWGLGCLVRRRRQD